MCRKTFASGDSLCEGLLLGSPGGRTEGRRKGRRKKSWRREEI
jgi:hypothetical protein